MLVHTRREYRLPVLGNVSYETCQGSCTEDVLPKHSLNGISTLSFALKTIVGKSWNSSQHRKIQRSKRLSPYHEGYFREWSCG